MCNQSGVKECTTLFFSGLTNVMNSFVFVGSLVLSYEILQDDHDITVSTCVNLQLSTSRRYQNDVKVV